MALANLIQRDLQLPWTISTSRSQCSTDSPAQKEKEDHKRPQYDGPVKKNGSEPVKSGSRCCIAEPVGGIAPEDGYDCKKQYGNSNDLHDGQLLFATFEIPPESALVLDRIWKYYVPLPRINIVLPFFPTFAHNDLQDGAN